MKSSKVLNYGTGIIFIVVGIGAVVGGLGVILDPSGKNMGVSVDLLKGSPFDNYLIPGIFLLSLNGLMSFIGAYFSFRKHRLSGIISMLLGLIMLIWMGAQIYWIGWESWLQPTFLIVGLIEIILGYKLLRRNTIDRTLVQK